MPIKTPLPGEEIKKPIVKHRLKMSDKSANVEIVDDATLNKALEHRVKTHATLWKELAKR